MYEILEIEESISAHVGVKLESTRETISNHMIFIGGSLDPSEELIYRSDSSCELMGTVIDSSISDTLLDVHFMKSDHEIDQISYFHPDSMQKSNEPKVELFENHDSRLISEKDRIQDHVIVEEVAEEEVISELLDRCDTMRENTHSRKEFECYKCERTFRRKKNLEYHIRSHTILQESINVKAPNGPRETNEVGSDSEENKRIDSPYESKKSSPQLIRCVDQSEDIVNINERTKYQRTLKYKCLYCERTFLSHTSVTEHARTEHGVHYDRFMCLYCGKQCKDLRGLQKHSKVHAGGELLLCNTCGKQFYSRNRLKRHMLSHRDKAVICEECGEKTTDHRALANHRSSHHMIASRSGSLTTRTFPCYACNKVFGSRSSQQIHMRIHTGERPYNCKYCVKAFADGGTLRKHERIHTGEKPYVCPICQKAFNQRVVLREHIRAHHAGPNNLASKFYKCEVCSTICSSSQDLCSHLVKHSDDNTAKHRTTGNRPRKYKKWKQTSNADAEGVDFVTAATDITKSAENLGDESFCILTDEEPFDDVQHDENEFISPSENRLIEFADTNKFHESGDNCALFADQMELQKWKILRDESINDTKSYNDSFSYQLLIPFDDKLPDECITIRDSCENGGSYSDTCLNLIEISDQRPDAYFENGQYPDYASKNRLRFTLKEKSDYSFDTEFCMHSGLGLGAIVELT